MFGIYFLIFLRLCVVETEDLLRRRPDDEPLLFGLLFNDETDLDGTALRRRTVLFLPLPPDNDDAKEVSNCVARACAFLTVKSRCLTVVDISFW